MRFKIILTDKELSYYCTNESSLLSLAEMPCQKLLYLPITWGIGNTAGKTQKGRSTEKVGDRNGHVGLKTVQVMGRGIWLGNAGAEENDSMLAAQTCWGRQGLQDIRRTEHDLQLVLHRMECEWIFGHNSALYQQWTGWKHVIPWHESMLRDGRESVGDKIAYQKRIQRKKEEVGEKSEVRRTQNYIVQIWKL